MCDQLSVASLTRTSEREHQSFGQKLSSKPGTREHASRGDEEDTSDSGAQIAVRLRLEGTELRTR